MAKKTKWLKTKTKEIINVDVFGKKRFICQDSNGISMFLGLFNILDFRKINQENKERVCLFLFFSKLRDSENIS